jgi:hypothetical protein
MLCEHQLSTSNLLQNGIDYDSFSNSVSDGLWNTALNAANEYKNGIVMEELSRFAGKNGLTLQEFNALLTLNSFLGNKLAGTRYHEDENNVSGYTSRKHGKWGIIWDVNDTILGYQGLIDACGYDYITGSKSGKH